MKDGVRLVAKPGEELVEIGRTIQREKDDGDVKMEVVMAGIVVVVTNIANREVLFRGTVENCVFMKVEGRMIGIIISLCHTIGSNGVSNVKMMQWKGRLPGSGMRGNFCKRNWS